MRRGGRYAVCHQKVTFDRHAGRVARDAALTVLETREENERVMGSWITHESFWIDLTDRDEEGQWVWADKTPVTYTGWAERQPDNHEGKEDCAHNNWNGFQWNMHCEPS